VRFKVSACTVVWQNRILTTLRGEIVEKISIAAEYSSLLVEQSRKSSGSYAPNSYDHDVKIDWSSVKEKVKAMNDMFVVAVRDGESNLT
jgi:orotate phosphoribosyltransferase-like protein